MLNSYIFAIYKIKNKSFDSAINKRKKFCIPHVAWKIIFLIKKSQKYGFLTYN